MPVPYYKKYFGYLINKTFKRDTIAYFKFIILGRLETVRIDASTICQLECSLCNRERIKKGVGGGYLKFEHFRKFVDNHTNVKNIELSNWGEIFLNPELRNIIKYSYEKSINLAAHSGVNLNTVDEETLECLVKYQFKLISISIDGASDGTYKIYRREGDFDKVVENIQRINYYKQRYNTHFPKLIWQFIVFGHNEHEIPIARKMAKELNMELVLSFNWSADYSPVKNKEFVRNEMGFASRQEFEQKANKNMCSSACNQFWNAPQVNWDGRLLGCCAHIGEDFGNVFESGLKKCLRSERYIYAKKMLSGKRKPREDIPCSYCSVYKWRQSQKCYVTQFGVMGLFKWLILKVPEKFIEVARLAIRVQEG